MLIESLRCRSTSMTRLFCLDLYPTVQSRSDPLALYSWYLAATHARMKSNFPMVSVETLAMR